MKTIFSARSSCICELRYGVKLNQLNFTPYSLSVRLPPSHRLENRVCSGFRLKADHMVPSSSGAQPFLQCQSLSSAQPSVKWQPYFYQAPEFFLGRQSTLDTNLDLILSKRPWRIWSNDAGFWPPTRRRFRCSHSPHSLDMLNLRFRAPLLGQTSVIGRHKRPY